MPNKNIKEKKIKKEKQIVEIHIYIHQDNTFPNGGGTHKPQEIGTGYKPQYTANC